MRVEKCHPLAPIFFISSELRVKKWITLSPNIIYIYWVQAKRWDALKIHIMLLDYYICFVDVGEKVGRLNHSN